MHYKPKFLSTRKSLDFTDLTWLLLDVISITNNEILMNISTQIIYSKRTFWPTRFVYRYIPKHFLHGNWFRIEQHVLVDKPCSANKLGTFSPEDAFNFSQYTLNGIPELLFLECTNLQKCFRPHLKEFSNVRTMSL